MKKIFALVLALVLVVAGASIAFAATKPTAAQQDLLDKLAKNYNVSGDEIEDMVRQLSDDDIAKIDGKKEQLRPAAEEVKRALELGTDQLDEATKIINTQVENVSGLLKEVGVEITAPSVKIEDGKLQATANVTVGTVTKELAVTEAGSSTLPPTPPTTDEPTTSDPTTDDPKPEDPTSKPSTTPSADPSTTSSTAPSTTPSTDPTTSASPAASTAPSASPEASDDTPKTGDEFPVAATLCFVAAGGVLLTMAINKGRKVFSDR